MTLRAELQYDVFLSHSAKDKHVVRYVAERLRKDGLRVWFDEWEICPGDNIPAKIEEGLDRSRVLVLSMSENAFGSDWAQLESETFRFRDPLNKERRFIPLRIDDAPVKGSLAQFLYISWLPAERESAYAKLLDACRASIKEPEITSKPGWLLEVIPLERVTRPRRSKLTKGGFSSLKARVQPLPVYAFNAEGSRAICASADRGKLCLWDLKSGRCIKTLRHGKRIRHIEWSKNESLVLLFEDEGKVRLLDVDQDRLLVDYSKTPISKRQMDCFRLLACGLSSREIQQRLGLWVLTAETHLLELRARLGFKKRNELRRYVTTFYAGRNRSTFPPIRIHPRWACALAWKIEKDRALSKKAKEFANLRLCTDFDGGSEAKEERRYIAEWQLAWKTNEEFVALGSDNGVVTLWNAKDGIRIRTFEGHLDRIECLAWHPNERFLLSGSTDETVRLWDTETGKSIKRFGLFTGGVMAIRWTEDGNRALVGDATNLVHVLDLSEFLGGIDEVTTLAANPSVTPEEVQYTNAKVLLVGDSHVGKTGLTHRLATGEWKASEDSTVGAWSTQLQLKDSSTAQNVDREIWLWDFGGQADQRLIHQLYMDRTALILLLFNADQEDVLPGLRDWQTALRRCVNVKIPHFLVAGRIDAGFKASRGKLQTFAKEQGLVYHETSAKSGEGCEQLRDAMIAAIPWAQMDKLTSPPIFKLIKDEILKLRDEGQVLHTFKELRELLWRRLPGEQRFTGETLQAVIRLLDGPGVVKELDYGTYILIAPEWVNAYAQAVIRTLRSSENDLGVLPLRSIAEGKLIYQSIGRDGAPVEMKRLPVAEERVVLGEMERQLEQRGLCLRQGDKLVFPSHCGRDRPAVLAHPSVFVSYSVKGFLDDIYATLVVKLADCQSFTLKELWRDAADFVTLADDHHMGIKLTRETASNGDISVYFGKGVTQQEQVIFANYIHAHLGGTCESALRLRHYVCPHCHTAKGNPEALMKKLLAKKHDADTECDGCGERFPLWDTLEKKFASDSVRRQVEELQADDLAKMSTRRRGKLLVLDVGARITSANQKWMEVPGDEDDGIDMILEFTDAEGNGIGKGLCLQLKAGNSHLTKRKDGTEIFTIKKARWVKTWTNQPFPVMLVIGTFPKQDGVTTASVKQEFADVRWMEITSVLRRETANGTKRVKQIQFNGERLDLASVRKWRQKALTSNSN